MTGHYQQTGCDVSSEWLRILTLEVVLVLLLLGVALSVGTEKNKMSLFQKKICNENVSI